MHTLYLRHQAKSGHRDELEKIWQRHMKPAIAQNPGHLAYIYSFETEPDVVTAFQVYRSKADAEAFLRSPPYLEYLKHSRELLQREPQITILEARWIKGMS